MALTDLSGKTAVITGAASGIGLALARHAATAGMNLVLADIAPERLDAAAATLGVPDTRLAVCTADLSLEADVRALAKVAHARFGAVHLLCNNAGVALTRLVREMRTADWEWVLGANLWSVIHGIGAFLPEMLARGEPAHIVNTASVAGLLSTPASAAYNVSKHGVVTLSETLYHELRDEQAPVGVSVLCPAWVNTGIGQAERNRPARLGANSPAGDISQAHEARIQKALTSGRLSADDIAAAVFSAVAEDRFYVIPHRRINEVVRRRFDDILEARNPSAAW